MEIHKRKSLTLKQKLDVVVKHPHCAVCGYKLGDLKEIEFDHWNVPLALGGSNEEDNFRGLHTNCHKVKTKGDIKTIAKVNRLRKKRLGLDKPKRKIPSRPLTTRKKLESRNNQSPHRRSESDAEPEEG